MLLSFSLPLKSCNHAVLTTIHDGNLRTSNFLYISLAVARSLTLYPLQLELVGKHGPRTPIALAEQACARVGFGTARSETALKVT